MKLRTTAIAAAIFASAASPAWAQSTAPAPAAVPTAARTLAPSKVAAKAIFELDAAVKANDLANLPAKFAAAEAVATTNNDKYLVASMRLKAGAAAHDSAQMIAGANGIATSGVETPEAVAKIYSALGTELYNSKQYGAAVDALQKTIALTPNDTDSLFNLGEAQFAAGQKAAAVSSLRKAISLSATAGQKPEEAMLKRAVGIAYNAQLPEAADIARDWVRAYPSAESWRNAIGIYRNLQHPDAQGSLDLMRLMQATNALKMPEDYTTFIVGSADQLNFNEAQKVYDAGIAAHVLDPTKADAVEIRNLLKVKAKATPADLETAIKSSPSAVYLLRIGDSFYAMGDYARAAAVYRDVMSKPGADRDLATLHLGMALARSGDKAGATAALNAVTGAHAGVAKYWLLYVQQQA
jgi:tetratricopeptide (TPR) repeat protein